MKILHLCLGNFFIDNCSYQENILPKYHVKQGYDVLVIASLFSFDSKGKSIYLKEASNYQDPNGFKIIRLANKKPTKWNRFFRHYKGLRQEIERFAPDIIFSHNLAYGDTPVVVRYLKKHPNTRVYADNHGDYINSAKNWFSKHILHPIIWKHYSKVLEPYIIKCYGVTPMRCRFLQEMYNISPAIIEYLPLGVDDDLIPKEKTKTKFHVRHQLGIEDDDILLFTGGKIDKLKNTHVLIDALKQIDSVKIHLIICGVLTQEMEYLADELAKNPRFHYMGWCNAKQVMDYMVASDIACFPGTHSTLWEQSVGVGLPAIFKRWPEMEHVNVNGNCIFIKGDNKEELNNAINNLIKPDNYILYKNLAEQASSFFLYSSIAKRAIGE